MHVRTLLVLLIPLFTSLVVLAPSELAAQDLPDEVLNRNISNYESFDPAKFDVDLMSLFILLHESRGLYPKLNRYNEMHSFYGILQDASYAKSVLGIMKRFIDQDSGTLQWFFDRPGPMTNREYWAQWLLWHLQSSEISNHFFELISNLDTTSSKFTPNERSILKKISRKLAEISPEVIHRLERDPRMAYGPLYGHGDVPGISAFPATENWTPEEWSRQTVDSAVLFLGEPHPKFGQSRDTWEHGFYHGQIARPTLIQLLTAFSKYYSGEVSPAAILLPDDKVTFPPVYSKLEPYPENHCKSVILNSKSK